MKQVNFILFNILCLVIPFNFLNSQQNIKLSAHQYSIDLPGGRVTFKVDSSKILLKLKNFNSINKIYFNSKYSKLAEFDSLEHRSIEKVTICYLKNSLTSNKLFNLIDSLKKDSIILFANPVLIYQDSIEQNFYDLFYVKIRDNSELDLLKQYSDQFNFLIQTEYINGIFFCKTSRFSNGSAFEIANFLQSKKVFEFIEPDFIYTGKVKTNDTYFNSQWALLNSGQFGGVFGSDIEAENTWSLTTGLSSIKVAVLDCFGSVGQFTHPDIIFHSTYDATGTGFNSSGYDGDAHGINCAGIIRATGNNSIGSAGLAYNCSVIAVKIGTIINSNGNWNATGTSISDGIIWSYQNADIISNSNTFGSESSLINNAIYNSITLGRNSLGTPFLSSSGNDNSSTIGYPASNLNAIAVGATSMCDQRKSPSSCDGENWGSNYGTGLDIAAPGVHIYTTDITGSAGYTSGSYNEYFNGTSAACPYAAGVLALIYSINPYLSYEQSRSILESTCEKVGGYTYNSGVPGQPNGTWSTALGYGRINSYLASLQSEEGNFCNNDFACGPPSPTILTISSNCINSSCSTIGATPPSPNIPFLGGATCTTPYQSGRYDDDVWFKIIPTTNSSITIRVAPTSNYSNLDLVIGLYQGTCSSPTQIGCADLNGVEENENLTFTPVANTTYLIRIFSYGIGNAYSGDFTICTFTGSGTPNLKKQSDGLTISGNTITINTTTQNNGTSTASPSIIRYALSTNSNFATIDYYIGTLTLPNINANSSSSQSKIVNLCNQGIPTGTYYVGYYIDYFQKITETIESDNGWFYWGSTPVTVSLPGNITVSGGGTHCNNATLSASGGTSGTIYWQGTTNNGTSTANPSTTQTVNSSGTYYFRAFNGCGWGPQGSANVTINSVPQPVNVSGGGTFCNSALLTASGGNGGTIYWQGTTSNGTSTSTPSTMQTVTTSGTYYFRAHNNCGWGNQGSATVNISPIVTNTNDSGVGSLRDRVNCANDGATITFNLAGQNTITLTTGEIDITKNLTIVGNGISNLTISGNNASRIFHILNGNTLTLKHLSLKNGNAPSPTGGALLIEGNINLENLLFDNNFENTTIRKAFTVANPSSLIKFINIVEIKD